MLPFCLIANRQFLIFLIGGFISVLIDIVTIELLIQIGTEIILAVSLGFLLGLTFNYFFHAILTFSSKATLHSLTRFLLIVSLNYLITICFVVFGKNLFDSVILAKVLSLPFVAINGYILSKLWAFR